MKHNKPSEDKILKKIAQIESELNENKIRSALLRAEGLVQTMPFDERIRCVLAKAYHYAGEFKSAGCHWALTNDNSDNAIKCKEIFIKFTENDPIIIFESYHFRELPFDKFKSVEANEFLNNIRNKLIENGYIFHYLTHKESFKEAVLSYKEFLPLDKYFFIAVIKVIFPKIIGTSLIAFIIYAAILQFISWLG